MVSFATLCSVWWYVIESADKLANPYKDAIRSK